MTTTNTPDNSIGFPSACMLSGIYTFATLPALSVTVTGVTYTALTSDQGLCYWTGAGWQSSSPTKIAQRRQQNTAAFLSGPLIPGTAWAATTAYVTGNVVTIANGQHIECYVSGTSGASIPVLSVTQLDGRPITDGSVTWYCLPRYATATVLGAPTVSSGASAAALGLTETQFVASGVVNPKVICFNGFLVASNGPQAYGFASGNSNASNNCNSQAATGGQPSTNSYYIYEYSLEFYVTDDFFGITMKNVTNELNIEIDGVLVSGTPIKGSGSNGFCVAFNYNGVVKRRLVRILMNTQNVLVQGVALSAIGTWEASDSPNDIFAIVGDSINMTITPSVSNAMAHLFQGYLQRLLGISGIFAMAGAGAGYYNANANTYNALAMLQNTANQAMLQLQNPGHILFDMGINDVGQPQANVLANALASWKLARSLCPTAKISVTDGWSQAGGPSAAQLTQAAAILAQFNAWADPNSRFIQVTTASAATAWVQGTANVSGAIATGNSCNIVSTDGIHPSPPSPFYLAKRMAYALTQAWNGNY